MTGDSAPSADEAANRRTLLMNFYRAFNERDIDFATEHLAPGVSWPHGLAADRITGRDAVRDYWLRQWRESDPRVEPLEITIEPDGTARVRVDQFVRSLDGKILANRRLEHLFEFEGPFISRMTVVDRGGDDDDDDDDGGDGDGGGEGEG